MFSFTGQSVNMLDWFSKLTLEVILSTAFGVDANIQMGESTEILERAKEIFKVPFIVRNLARLRFGSLLLRRMAFLRGTKPGYFQGVANEIIKTRRQQGLTGRKDLLHLMMIANDETTEGVSKLSDDEIVAQSIIFLLAGYETSSNTLAFTLYHLAVNPDIQNKLRAEIKEAMESNAKKPLYDVVLNIVYLDCIIKEAQRLYPAAAQVNRQCSEDYDYNRIHIPAGTEIAIPIYVIHHDPDAWQDPEKFDPERFRGPAKDTRHDAFQFLPFGAGPRTCIGMRFALMEIKIALVRILMKYKFVQSPETQVPLVIHPGATLSARDGVSVRVESIV